MVEKEGQMDADWSECDRDRARKDHETAAGNAPVRARLGTRLVQVDKHLGVTERASAWQGKEQVSGRDEIGES